MRTRLKSEDKKKTIERIKWARSIVAIQMKCNRQWIVDKKERESEREKTVSELMDKFRFHQWISSLTLILSNSTNACTRVMRMNYDEFVFIHSLLQFNKFRTKIISLKTSNVKIIFVIVVIFVVIVYLSHVYGCNVNTKTVHWPFYAMTWFCATVWEVER